MEKKIFNKEKYNVLKKALEIAENNTTEQIQEMIKASSNMTIEDMILDEVSSEFCISVEHIRSKTRRRDIIDPRQIAMYFLREYTELSLKSIGDVLGGKHYTTVIHSINCVSNNMFLDSYKRRVERIDKSIKIVIQ
jgi:chromosomal replication initiator protein